MGAGREYFMKEDVNCFKSPEYLHKKDEDRSSGQWIEQDEVALTLIGAVPVEWGRWKYTQLTEKGMRNEDIEVAATKDSGTILYEKELKMGR